ncbi:MAG: hypothetical protein COV60_03035 [Candidatus Magasanikbacteria bacterium CG11_big_fil_rev_8_21_14_0_20_43_7]|uniref:DUF218 domain-containing protein n=1 Tax=Candidatus Magasanikbacteria bacterium CG11_big_fil_rev_8_21_14_0_20_43_7 TaxID=1974654 RepID=A0A2H0N209_9BACT|nr:MAG: hypothetical protein COV60_03035 [Candidatus Magasanikbacteria bacterium CG11_big_fil_rev_8_21_14_0_20_43_7]
MIVEHNAKILWDYHHMNHNLVPSDCILVMCSHDTRVAEYASELFLRGLAPIIVFSGGIAHEDDLLSTGWEKPEAEVFADVAMSRGVPKETIILETHARNCGENIWNTKRLLADLGMDILSVILVQKPYMERRAFATIRKLWSEVDVVVTSPPIGFENYPTQDIPFDTLVNIMVGDLQRMIEYPKQGFQIEQDIPHSVLKSYEALKQAGYTKHLISNLNS